MMEIKFVCQLFGILLTPSLLQRPTLGSRARHSLASRLPPGGGRHVRPSTHVAGHVGDPGSVFCMLHGKLLHHISKWLDELEGVLRFIVVLLFFLRLCFLLVCSEGVSFGR